jgi:hypothetical protein
MVLRMLDYRTHRLNGVAARFRTCHARTQGPPAARLDAAGRPPQHEQGGLQSAQPRRGEGREHTSSPMSLPTRVPRFGVLGLCMHSHARAYNLLQLYACGWFGCLMTLWLASTRCVMACLGIGGCVSSSRSGRRSLRLRRTPTNRCAAIRWRSSYFETACCWLSCRRASSAGGQSCRCRYHRRRLRPHRALTTRLGQRGGGPTRGREGARRGRRVASPELRPVKPARAARGRPETRPGR